MRETTHYGAVFLIPEKFNLQSEVYNRKGGYIWVEWEWHIRNPQAMKNVLFVVGHNRSIGPRQNVVHVSNPTNDVHLHQLLDNPESYLLIW